MKILQINSVVNLDSTGRIAEEIGLKIISNGWDSYIAFGRDERPSRSIKIKIGTDWDVKMHGVHTRLFDRHGFGSKTATQKFIEQLEILKPDIIHLHNIHGYYINIEVLFNYLSFIKVPVVWTFHDCWAFTGHCAHFEYVNCNKWKTECHECPQLKGYPKTLFFDRSTWNFNSKKELFSSLDNLVIVPVSNWLSKIVKQSFLNTYPIKVINNGINLDLFTTRDSKDKILTKHSLRNKFIVLGVTGTWGKLKGLDSFYKLNEMLNKDYSIILVGLNDEHIKTLPKGIVGIKKTESISELADYYSAADVFVNPTLEDTFPTTNLESLACGTPVITFKTGGSVEAVSLETGIVVEKENIEQLILAIEEVKSKTKMFYSARCRERAVQLYNKDDRYNDYIKLYKSLVNKV